MSLRIVTQADIGSGATPTPARFHGPASRTLNLPDKPRNAVFHRRPHVHRPSCITNHLILFFFFNVYTCISHSGILRQSLSPTYGLLVGVWATTRGISSPRSVAFDHSERTKGTHLQFCLRVSLEVARPSHPRSTAADGELVKYRTPINSLCATHFRGLKSALGLNFSGRTRQYMGTNAEHCMSDYPARGPESTLLKSTKVNQT